MARFVSTAFVNHKFHNAGKARAPRTGRTLELLASSLFRTEQCMVVVLWVLWVLELDEHCRLHGDLPRFAYVYIVDWAGRPVGRSVDGRFGHLHRAERDCA